MTHTSRTLRALVCGAVAALLLALLPSTSTAQTRTDYREGGLATAVAAFLATPSWLPGVNDWGCRPQAGQDPVVLVHATGVNLGSNWVKLAPRLKNGGACVYALNYGMTPLSLGRVGGQGPVRESVRQLAAFVERVRTATGSAKVDLVGHSQGGLVSVAYVKLEGGAATVDDLVSIAGSQNGTTLNGLATLAQSLGVLGLASGVANVLGVAGWTDQARGSAFLQGLWTDPTLPAGPDYTTIMTRHDRVVTPWQSGALPGARNLVVQDLCPADPVGHVGMFLDEPTVQLVAHYLGGGAEGFRPECRGYGPAL